MVSNEPGYDLPSLTYSPLQTAKRPLMVSGKTSVRFYYDKEQTPYLTER